MATENSEQSNEQPDSGTPEQHSWYDGFKLRSIAFAQYLGREISRRERSNQQDDTAPKSLDWLVITAAAIAAAAIIRILMAAGAFEDSNRIIAILTFVLSVVGALQWWTYHRQWQVMRDQHSTMEKQIRLAKKASAQTETIIQQMRLEQRAWVYVDKVEAPQPQIGTRLVITITLKNSGHTPAEIFGGAMLSKFRERDVDNPKFIHDFDKQILERWYEYFIPPHGEITLCHDHPDAITEELERDARLHTPIFVIGQFAYRDAMKGLHRCKFFFARDVFSDRFEQQAGYCSTD